MKCLAIMLFHNDKDIVEEQIQHMTDNKHDIIIFNHNSTDNTQQIIDKLAKEYKNIVKSIQRI